MRSATRSGDGWPRHKSKARRKRAAHRDGRTVHQDLKTGAPQVEPSTVAPKDQIT